MKLNFEERQIGAYTYRLLRKEDAFDYYQNNLNPLDSEIAYFTGSPTYFDKEVVLAYVDRCVDSEDVYYFVIVDGNTIFGECVINDVDLDNKRAGIRIAILQKEYLSKGLGTQMMRKSLEFAFSFLGIEEIELEVFDINSRAQATYNKLGFQQVGVRKNEKQQSGEIVDVYDMILKKKDYID